jgi:hypothetical protein
MSDDETESDEAEQTSDEIWGDRAQSVVLAVKNNGRPMRMASLNVFAQRKGWEPQTLRGALLHCENRKLLVKFKSITGEPAYKLPTMSESEGVTEALDQVGRAVGGVRHHVRVLLNVGEPAAALAAAAKEKTVEKKDWVSFTLAAQMLGLSKPMISLLVKSGKLERRGEGADSEVSRASVIKVRAERSAKAKAKAEAKPKAAKQKAKAKPRAARAAQAVPPAQSAAEVAAPSPDMATAVSHVREVVGAFATCVQIGAMTLQQAWDQLVAWSAR